MEWRNNFDIVERVWGYNNNGVKASNVSFNNDLLILTANPYAKVGAAVSSKVLYGQGSYEFVAKTNVPNGACVAFWTYFYNDDDSNESTPNINHEIDFELYGTNNIIYSSYLKDVGEQTHINSKVDYQINDNEYHTYRFDWYSGKKIEFYIDNILVATIEKYVPTEKMKVWIGLWCPEWSIQKDELGNASPALVEGATYTMTVKSFTYDEFSSDDVNLPTKVNPIYTKLASGAYTISGFIDGNGNNVTIDSSLYTIHYESNEQYVGTEAPTTPGVYSLVVELNSESNLEFIDLNIAGLTKKVWKVFTLE